MQIEGILHKKGITTKVNERFKKREFVIRDDSNQYKTNYIKFELHQDNVSILDSFDEGDKIEILFDIMGREWQENVYNTLKAWKIQKK